MIGSNALIETLFGVKVQCYADFTASGKPLQSVEDFMQKQVLPLYGDTHTLVSATGIQMTVFREDARQIIAQAVNGKTNGPDSTDCAVFTSQGATSAVNKLVVKLGLTQLGAHRDLDRRTVVFVGAFEHYRTCCHGARAVPRSSISRRTRPTARSTSPRSLWSSRFTPTTQSR